MKFAVIILLGILLTMAGAVMPALAEDGECHFDSELAFGEHHSDMAQLGMLDAEHNPGMHEGYSPCVP